MKSCKTLVLNTEIRSHTKKTGEYHIPYYEHIKGMVRYATDDSKVPDKEYLFNCLKVSVAMCARVSYTVVGDEKEISLDTYLNIYDKLIKGKPFHASPFEHIGKAGRKLLRSRNFKGFYQYRQIIESSLSPHY